MASSSSWLIYRSGIFVIIGGTTADVLFVTFLLFVRSCLTSKRKSDAAILAHSKPDFRLLVLSLAVAVSSLALTVCLAVTTLIPTSETADCRGLAVADKVLLALLASFSSYLLARSATASTETVQIDMGMRRQSAAIRPRAWRFWHKTIDSAHTVFLYSLHASLLLESVGWIAWISTTREDYTLVMLKEGGTFCLVYLHSKLLPFAFSCSLLPSLLVMISPICRKGMHAGWRPLLPVSLGGLMSFLLRALALLSMLCEGIYGPQQLTMVAAICFAASAARFPTPLQQLTMDDGHLEQCLPSRRAISERDDSTTDKPGQYFTPMSSAKQPHRASLPDLERGTSCFSRPATALSWGGIKPAWSPIHPLQAQTRSRHQVKSSLGIPHDVSSPSVASYKVMGDANSVRTPDTPREQWHETCPPGDAFPFRAIPRPPHVACDVESHEFGRFLGSSIDIQQSSTGEGDAFYRQRTKSDSILLDREPPKRKSVPALEDEYSMTIQASRKQLGDDKEAFPTSVTPNLAQNHNKDDDDGSVYSRQSAFAESAVIDYLQREDTLGVRSRTTSIQPLTTINDEMPSRDSGEGRASFQSSRVPGLPRRRQTSVGSNLIFECKPSRLSVDSSAPEDPKKSFLEEHNLALERPQSKMSIRRLLRSSTMRKMPSPSGAPREDPPP